MKSHELVKSFEISEIRIKYGDFKICTPIFESWCMTPWPGHRTKLIPLFCFIVNSYMDIPNNQWIDTWLTQRFQQVVLDGVSSVLVPVQSGVPQGTVLSPLMFLLYINE